MSEQTGEKVKLRANDRVKRLYKPEAVQFSGCYGTVKEVRREVTASSAETQDKTLMVTVQWDNGTFSYHGHDALIVVEAGK